MKRNITLLIALLLASSMLFAQNLTVNDTVDVNTTWTADTIFVDTNIVILDDIILSIDPGVVVVFNDFYRIDVQGTIKALGTEQDSIKFTVIDTTGFYEFDHTAWNGIEFDNEDGSMTDNEASMFDYCIFSYGAEWDNEDGGGAILIDYYKDLTITNCLFFNNYAYENGGAIGVMDEAEVLIDNCKFLCNHAEEGGGAINIGCYDIEEVPSTPIIQNCIFMGNRTYYDDDRYYGGAAIKTSSYATTRIINNIITDNHSLSAGGGILISGYGHPYVSGNIIYNNTAGSNGGGIKLSYETGALIANNTIVNNTAIIGGGGIHSGCDDGTIEIINNIILSNIDSTSSAGNLFFSYDNKRYILKNNNIGGGSEDILVIDKRDDRFLKAIPVSDVPATINFTEIGVYLDNIDADPIFTDAENGDFTVACNSPILNAGMSLNNIPESDINGNPRINDEIIDMGAVENINAALIISQPDLIVCDEGTSAVFSVIAENTNSYLWQLSTDIGQTWTDLSDGTKYSGTATNELTIASTQLSMNSNMYRCMVEGPCKTAPTVSAFLIVNSTASINAELISNINIYPNPSEGLITIQASGMVKILNASGQIIKAIDMSATNEATIDLSDFSNGVYFVRISGENFNATRKLIIK